jgi:hypothetical protein
MTVALTMEAVGPSETSVSFCETTRRNIPEHSHFQFKVNLNETDVSGKLRQALTVRRKRFIAGR